MTLMRFLLELAGDGAMAGGGVPRSTAAPIQDPIGLTNSILVPLKRPQQTAFIHLVQKYQHLSMACASFAIMACHHRAMHRTHSLWRPSCIPHHAGNWEEQQFWYEELQLWCHIHATFMHIHFTLHVA